MDNSKGSLCKSVEPFSRAEYNSRCSARTFMHTLGTDSAVGLLLFDEPSAALDPVAEHGIVPSSVLPFLDNDLRPEKLELFSRLHESRGKRTMVFSTHRFGNLTKYADIIVCAHLKTVK